MVVRLSFALHVWNEMCNSQEKTHFNHFPQRWHPYHYNCDRLVFIREGLLIIIKKKEKRKKNIMMLYLMMILIMQLSYDFRMAELTLDWQVYQRRQLKKSYDRRESSLWMFWGLKNHANFAAKMDMSRNDTTFAWPHDLATALRTQAIFQNSDRMTAVRYLQYWYE